MSKERVSEHRELSRPEIDQMLERNHLGRVAYSFHNEIEIEPVGYVYNDGLVYGRTSEGAKLEMVKHNPWIAFEVDELGADGIGRSVLIRGFFDILEPELSESEKAKWERAVQVITEAFPYVLGPDDPAPHRQIFFRIHPQSISGREVLFFLPPRKG